MMVFISNGKKKKTKVPKNKENVRLTNPTNPPPHQYRSI